MDKATAKAIGLATEAALQEVAARFGMTVRAGGGRYDPSTGTFSPRIEFAEADSERRAFEADAPRLYMGLKAEDYNAEVRLMGETFRLTGIKLASPKFPILATRSDGKVFKLTASSVLRALGREVPPGVA